MKKLFNLLLIAAFASGLNAQQSIAPHAQELKKSTADETLAPAKVTNLGAISYYNGTNYRCELTWTNPSTNVAGDTITESFYVITKRGGKTSELSRQTSAPGSPGSKTDNDNTLTEQEYTYSVFVRNIKDGKESDAVSIIVPIGGDKSTITDFPFVEGFEDYTSIQRWKNEATISIYPWVFCKGSPHTSSSAIKDPIGGKQNASFRPSGGPSAARLITPKMDISSLANPVLTFWHSQKVWISDQDILRVYYKNSEAGDWIPLAEYTSNIASWTEEIIPLPNQSGEYYIAFHAVYGSGYGITLDDVKVEDAGVDVDVAVTEIVAPVNKETFTAAEEVTVRIKNNGDKEISGIPVTLESDGAIIATETIEGPIPSLETIEYTFGATVDMSSPKDYELKVYTALSKDIDLTNDTISVELLTLPKIYKSCDFEQGIPKDFGLINSDNAEIHNDLINIFKSNDAWMIITDEEPSQVATNSNNNNNSNSTNAYAASASYFTSTETQANRWMILPKASLESNAVLEWDASSADEGDLADGYKIMLSTTYDETLSPNDVSSFNETLFSIDKEASTWKKRTVKLPFSEQPVYIAFVQNSLNKRYIKIDNINIRGKAKIGTSIISSEDAGIKIYPNPVTDNITIENGSGAEARIFDISGKLLINTKIKSNTELIDLNRLTTGIYFINVQNKDIKTSGKFIKK